MALPEDERYINPANPNQLVRKMEKIAPQFVYKTDNNHNLTAVFSEHNIKRGALVIVVLKKKEGFDKENMSPIRKIHGEWPHSRNVHQDDSWSSSRKVLRTSLPLRPHSQHRKR